MAFPVRWFMWVPAAFNLLLTAAFAYSFWVGWRSADLTRCVAMVALVGLSTASCCACCLAALGKCPPTWRSEETD